MSTKTSSTPLRSGKVLAFFAVILIHAGVMSMLMKPVSNRTSLLRDSFIQMVFFEATEDASTLDTSPLPDLKLVSPRLDADGLVLVGFEDPEDDAIVVGPASSPRLSRVQAMTPELFAHKKGLVLRQPQAVLLAVLVLEDGHVAEVRVTRSSGDDAIDAAAIEYARTLHWIAGTQDHRTHSMKVSLPVIFT